MVDIQSATAEIRVRREKKRR